MGREVNALVVGSAPKGGMLARSQEYKPVVVSEDVRPGDFVRVRIVEAGATYLKGVVVS